MWNYDKVIDIQGPNLTGKYVARVSITSGKEARTEMLYFVGKPNEAVVDAAAMRLIGTLNAAITEEAELRTKSESLEQDRKAFPLYMEPLSVVLDVAMLLIKHGRKEMAVQLAEVIEPKTGLTTTQRNNFNTAKAKLITKLSSF